MSHESATNFCQLGYRIAVYALANGLDYPDTRDNPAWIKSGNALCACTIFTGCPDYEPVFVDT